MCYSKGATINKQFKAKLLHLLFRKDNWRSSMSKLKYSSISTQRKKMENFEKMHFFKITLNFIGKFINTIQKSLSFPLVDLLFGCQECSYNSSKIWINLRSVDNDHYEGLWNLCIVRIYNESDIFFKMLSHIIFPPCFLFPFLCFFRN
jgi:hypothetical protein